MLSVAEAEKIVLAHVPALPAEDCPLAQAHGRVLRAGLRADRDWPPFDRVTLDGYALRRAAWAAGARRFRVEGTQAAGMIPLKVKAEDGCVEVMTGAVLPTGADCVVPYEDTARADAFMAVSPEVKIETGQAVHRRGSDYPANAVVAPAGVRLGGREIAVAAACGGATLSVTTLPAIAVVATGDELVEVSASVAPHQIRRSNDYALRASLIQAGYPRVERFHLRDMRHEIMQGLRRLITEFDVVLLTGGVSKGKYDHLPRVLEELGVKKLLQGVAQRPGKPFWFGLSPRQTPVFALPGNPVSACVCLHRYVLPALAKMSGAPPAPLRLAALAVPVVFKPPLAWFLPVRLASGAHGELLATPDPVNTSGDFAGLVGTDGFVELPADQENFPAGHVAPFWLWV